MKTILITGGSGFIGSALTQKLLDHGFEVKHLSRTENLENIVKRYKWDVKNEYVDPRALENVSTIIHLAGAPIVDKPWTNTRKKELIGSRVDTANLLLKKVEEHQIQLDTFISSSGTGYYGAHTSETIFNEQSSNGSDFVSKICVEWENAAQQFKKKGIRTVIVRTPLVLSKLGGAYLKLIEPIKFGFGAALGSGNQWVPWVHLDDLIQFYLDSVENFKLKGIYNVVAPEHVTFSYLNSELARSINKKIWMPNIPSLIIKILLGERARLVLEGSRVCSDRTDEIKIKYPTIKAALREKK